VGSKTDRTDGNLKARDDYVISRVLAMGGGPGTVGVICTIRYGRIRKFRIKRGRNGTKTGVRKCRITTTEREIKNKK